MGTKEKSIDSHEAGWAVICSVCMLMGVVIGCLL
jgi:hypothetical protein